MAARPAGAGARATGRMKLPHVEPGGWAFEYANNSYPDIDDTAVALIALAPFRNDPKWQAKGIEEAIQLARRLADRHAEPRRRLGRLRQGQRQEDPDQDPVLRFRRGARSAVRRRHGACRRGVRASSGFRASIRRWSARSTISGASRRRTAPGSAAGASITSTARRAVLPALAAIGEDMSQPYIGRACDWLSGLSAGERRLGRELRILHGHEMPPAAAPPPPRRPPGR